MYVCGMTPKDPPHIGHARLFVHVDVMRRYLEYRGYRIQHVQNFTDIDDKIIERAREQYEGSHGSEVLRRASEHLERITSGRYTQILRVVEDPGYQLVEASGSYRSPIPPHVSRSAFAQIYLSIRLAYAEKGTHSNLPIILDDAYEGYDDERMPPALDILCELGEMRQVMLFSHHGHICEAAEARGVPVIQL